MISVACYIGVDRVTLLVVSALGCHERYPDLMIMFLPSYLHDLNAELVQ